MLTDPGTAGIDRHRIEVSGWDRNESFFVEKTNLLLSGSQDKRVRLRHSLRESAVIFVRVLHTTRPSDVCPVAYQVKGFVESTSATAYEYNLTRLHPKGSPR